MQQAEAVFNRFFPDKVEVAIQVLLQIKPSFVFLINSLKSEADLLSVDQKMWAFHINILLSAIGTDLPRFLAAVEEIDSDFITASPEEITNLIKVLTRVTDEYGLSGNMEMRSDMEQLLSEVRATIEARPKTN